jgi:hypothetical protein
VGRVCLLGPTGLFLGRPVGGRSFCVLVYVALFLEGRG